MNSPCAKKNNRRRSGFAITEVVVSALLMLITFAGIMGFISYTVRSNYSTRVQGLMTAMSHDLFTTLETSTYANIRGGSDSVYGSYARAWTVSEANSAKTVTLNLTFNDPMGKRHHASYKQIFHDPDVSGFIGDLGSSNP